MPASVLARIAERRPDVWTSAMVEELLVQAYRTLQRRGVMASSSLTTATGSMGAVDHVNIITLAMDALRAQPQERDILLCVVKREAFGQGLSHTSHALERYGRSRKWLLGVRKSALKRISAHLNSQGISPTELAMGQPAPDS